MITTPPTRPSKRPRPDLGQAIDDSNATPGPNTIDFKISGNGPFTIALNSPLPPIIQPVVAVIDGTSQPGYSGVPLISLTSSTTPSTVDPFTGDGLTLLGGGSTVQGLGIEEFNGNGIRITRGGGNVIQNNRIGTDPAGATKRPDSGSGILIEASSNNTSSTTSCREMATTGIKVTETAASLVLSDTLSGIVLGSLHTDVTGCLPFLFREYSLQGLLHGAFFNLNISNASGLLHRHPIPCPALLRAAPRFALVGHALGAGSLPDVERSGKHGTDNIHLPFRKRFNETFTLKGTLGGFPYTFNGTFNGTFLHDGTTVRTHQRTHDRDVTGDASVGYECPEGQPDLREQDRH